MKIVVIGGSVGGLTTALLAARGGAGVVVLEGDAAVAEAVDPADAEVRRTTPQAGHSHIFLSRLRQLLLDRAPDVLDALTAAGAHEIDMAAGRPQPLASAVLPRPDDLVALACRRPVFEAVLRTAVVAEPNVAVRAGVRATALELASAGRDDPPSVTGVVLDDDNVVAGDLVVDASGRRTSVPGWLEEAGIDVPLQIEECGIAYVSRFYELRPGATPPRFTRGFTTGSSFDRYSCLIFPGDGRTFSVTFGVLPEDRDLRGLTHPDAFDAAVSAIPSLAWWVQPYNARPISDAKTMTGLKNRLRRYRVDDQPLVLGVAAVGDAVSTTNPAHSRGSTLAMVMGVATADAALAADGDLEVFNRLTDDAIDAEVVPWFHDSMAQDAARLSRWRPGSPAPEPDTERVTNGEMVAAAQVDADSWLRFARLQNLVHQPDEVLADPGVVEQVRGVLASDVRGPVATAPSHDELAALVAEAQGGEARRRSEIPQVAAAS